MGDLMNRRLDRDLERNGAAKYAHGQNTTRRAKIDVAARNLNSALVDLDDQTEGSSSESEVDSQLSHSGSEVAAGDNSDQHDNGEHMAETLPTSGPGRPRVHRSAAIYPIQYALVVYARC